MWHEGIGPWNTKAGQDLIVALAQFLHCLSGEAESTKVKRFFPNLLESGALYSRFSTLRKTVKMVHFFYSISEYGRPVCVPGIMSRAGSSY